MIPPGRPDPDQARDIEVADEVMEASLPSVAGRMLLVSHVQFELSCLVLLREEQDKPLPNNALVDCLCNAVRLSREHVDAITQP